MFFTASDDNRHVLLLKVRFLPEKAGNRCPIRHHSGRSTPGEVQSRARLLDNEIPIHTVLSSCR